jgi:hypothetical protein
MSVHCGLIPAPLSDSAIYSSLLVKRSRGLYIQSEERGFRASNNIRSLHKYQAKSSKGGVNGLEDSIQSDCPLQNFKQKERKSDDECKELSGNNRQDINVFRGNTNLGSKKHHQRSNRSSRIFGKPNPTLFSISYLLAPRNNYSITSFFVRYQVVIELK